MSMTTLLGIVLQGIVEGPMKVILGRVARSGEC
jgi:hypothetical protein